MKISIIVAVTTKPSLSRDTRQPGRFDQGGAMMHILNSKNNLHLSRSCN